MENLPRLEPAGQAAERMLNDDYWLAVFRRLTRPERWRARPACRLFRRLIDRHLIPTHLLISDSLPLDLARQYRQVQPYHQLHGAHEWRPKRGPPVAAELVCSSFGWLREAANLHGLTSLKVFAKAVWDGQEFNFDAANLRTLETFELHGYGDCHLSNLRNVKLPRLKRLVLLHRFVNLVGLFGATPNLESLETEMSTMAGYLANERCMPKHGLRKLHVHRSNPAGSHDSLRNLGTCLYRLEQLSYTLIGCCVWMDGKRLAVPASVRRLRFNLVDQLRFEENAHALVEKTEHLDRQLVDVRVTGLRLHGQPGEQEALLEYLGRVAWQAERLAQVEFDRRLADKCRRRHFRNYLTTEAESKVDPSMPEFWRFSFWRVKKASLELNEDQAWLIDHRNMWGSWIDLSELIIYPSDRSQPLHFDASFLLDVLHLSRLCLMGLIPFQPEVFAWIVEDLPWLDHLKIQSSVKPVGIDDLEIDRVVLVDQLGGVYRVGQIILIAVVGAIGLNRWLSWLTCMRRLSWLLWKWWFRRLSCHCSVRSCV